MQTNLTATYPFPSAKSVSRKAKPTLPPAVRFGFTGKLRETANGMWAKLVGSKSDTSSGRIIRDPSLVIRDNDPALQALLTKQQKQGIVFFDALKDGAEVFNQRKAWREAMDKDASVTGFQKNMIIFDLMLARFMENYPNRKSSTETKSEEGSLDKPIQPSDRKGLAALKPNRHALRAYRSALLLNPQLTLLPPASIPFDVLKQTALAAKQPQKVAEAFNNFQNQILKIRTFDSADESARKSWSEGVQKSWADLETLLESEASKPEAEELK